MPEAKTAKTAKTANTDIRARRKKPLSGKALRMQVDEELFQKYGLRAFWALDRPGRINELLEAGYRFVSEHDLPTGAVTELESRENAYFVEAAGRDRHTNAPLRQYLMALPLELHEEDMQARRAERNERMSQIKSGSRHDDPDHSQRDTSKEIRVEDTTGAF